MRTFFGVLIGVAMLFAAASCGSDGVSAEGLDDLDGQEYWSAEVLEDGQPRSLVAGTRITLRFNGDQIGASSGCNSLGGTFEVDGSVLSVADLFMTEMGCDPDRHAQDDFLASVLLAGPTVALVGDELTLTTPTVDMRLLNTAVANPDREIIGSQWTVSGFIDGQTASSMAVTQPGSLQFSSDATMTGFDGCAQFNAAVEVSDGSTGGPVEGDGEMQFGSVERQVVTDCPDAGYADQVHRMFETGDATFTITGTNLTVLNSAGVGVTFTAE